MGDKRIWITGCGGFLGSHLADFFLQQGAEVFGNDTFIGGEQRNVPKLVDCYLFDCLDIAELALNLKRLKITHVYHTAALAYEGLSVFSPALVTKNIYGGSVSVISACIQSGVEYYVQCSSMARYGALTPPFTEDMQPMPVDPYGIAKYAADRTLQVLAKQHSLNYTIAVPHNIIGPRQRYYDPYRNVASIMINLMLQGRQPIIYGDGSQMRCFSFVEDCIRPLSIMPFVPEANGQVINIGPDKGTVTIIELAQTIASLINFKLDPIFMPGRPLEVHHANCSADKARKILGYEAKTSLRDGLKSMIEHIRKQGTKPFKYHLKLEIENDKTPKTWKEKLF